MIFQFGQHMADKEKERGRLFSIQMDGSDSVPFIIKKDKLLIGRGDSCEIRIYVEGVAHEHCVLTFNEEGRGFVESVNKCGLTFLNGVTIERQVSLEHNDVITVVKRSFRFHYPSSSKFYVPSEPAASFEDNTVKVLADFEVEDVLSKRGKDLSEKRVTFGPRLSPEEFDKRMPPASPLRKGSLPRDKFKAKTPSYEQEIIKSQVKKNLFVNSPANKITKNRGKSTPHKMPESSVVLKRLNCSSRDVKETLQEESSKPSRPLFSEIVKKSAVNPAKNTVQTAAQKFSPQKFIKTKVKDSRRIFYKSPRRPAHPRVLAVGSTGHANSPETIVISKKRFSPYSQRNSVSSVKRRKSLRLLQEKVVTETSSEQSSVDENNVLLSENNTANENIEQNVSFSRTPSTNKTSIQIPTVEPIKQKMNDAIKNVTPAKNRSKDASFSKRNENCTPEGNFVNYASTKKSVGTPARKNVGTLARKGIGTLAKKSIGTPARKSIGTPARKSIGTPARKSIGTPTRKNTGTPLGKSLCTPTRESSNTRSMKAQDEMFDEFDDDELEREFPEEVNENEKPDEFDEDGLESELSGEVNENEMPSTSSSLVAAINNVAQIDENNLDRSLNDIHNIVQALSCHSNVPTLGSDRLTSDMCTNAMRKLALTISMINAFHTFNRIIDDVSTFPLCFPSASFESNRDSMRRLPRSGGHQNDDFAGMSVFQDLRDSFLLNSATHRREGILERCENSLDSDNETLLSNRRSRRSPRSRIFLRAIDSDHITPPQKSGGSNISPVSKDDETNESNHSDNSSSDYGGVSAVSSSSHLKSPRTPMCNVEKSSSATTSRNSVSLDDILSDSPSLHATSADELSFSNDLDLQNSKRPRMTSAFAERPSTSKAAQSVSSSVSSGKPKTSLILCSKPIKVAPVKMPNECDCVIATNSKILPKKISTLRKPKQPKVSVLSKKIGMTKSKKLKALKQQQKHRSAVLKKVKYRVASPKVKISKITLKSPTSLRKSFKRSSNQSDLLKPKLVRLSQKIVKKAKSKKKLSSALRLSRKLVTPPKGLRESANRKSVLFKSKGIRSKKSSGPARLSSDKKISANFSTTESTNKRAKRNRSVNVKSGMYKKSDVLKYSQSTDNNSEKIVVNSKTRSQRKGRISDENLNSIVAKKRSGDINKKNDVPVSTEKQFTKTDSEKVPVNARIKSQSKRKLKMSEDLVVMEENSDNFNKENNAFSDVKSQSTNRDFEKPAARNQRKRKRKSEIEQPEKALVAAEKRKGRSRIQKIITNTQVVSSKENEGGTLSEVSENDQPHKKLRTTKKNKHIQANENYAATVKRTTRSTRSQNTEDTQVYHALNEEQMEIKVNKKTIKQSKAGKAKKSEIKKVVTPLKKARSSKRKNLETMKNLEHKETVVEDLEKVEKKRGRKRNIDKNISKSSAKIPELTEEKFVQDKIATKKDKKTMSSSKATPKKDMEKVERKGGRRRKIDKNVSKSCPKTPELEEEKVIELKTTSQKDKEKIPISKATPKKGRSKGVSKTANDKNEDKDSFEKVSPVQRVQRSLRSRK